MWGYYQEMLGGQVQHHCIALRRYHRLARTEALRGYDDVGGWDHSPRLMARTSCSSRYRSFGRPERAASCLMPLSVGQLRCITPRHNTSIGHVSFSMSWQRNVSFRGRVSLSPVRSISCWWLNYRGTKLMSDDRKRLPLQPKLILASSDDMN
jgi:hypothetical protein